MHTHTYALSRTILSHTHIHPTFTHDCIHSFHAPPFDIHLLHTPILHHLFFLSCISHPIFTFLLLLIGKSWPVGLSGPLICDTDKFHWRPGGDCSSESLQSAVYSWGMVWIPSRANNKNGENWSPYRRANLHGFGFVVVWNLNMLWKCNESKKYLWGQQLLHFRHVYPNSGLKASCECCGKGVLVLSARLIT